MTTIRLTFPWGRYYAHPWGINPTRLREAEWPPSPWRLLRALVSAWFRTHPGQIPSTDCIALIESLGRERPEIGFAKISFGQTVHWQPNYGAADKDDKADARYKNTRHENHFVAVHGPVFFHWPNTSLASHQWDLLKLLLEHFAYFGRAESLCHAELCTAKPADPCIGWCTPNDGRKISSLCRDVFCPDPGDFTFTDLWIRRKDPAKHDATHAPPHFVDTLLASDLKPDGAKWISYRMPDDWPHRRVVRVPRSSKAPRTPTPGEGPKIAHYLCFSLQCRVPIPLKFAVPLSEKFRAAANFHLCKTHGDGTPSFALFGHEKPVDVTSDHQHAFYLPMSRRSADKDDPENREDQDRFLRYLHIWCPYGFTQAEVEILMRVQRLDWGSGRYPVRPVLVALSKDPPADLPFSTGRTAAHLWRSVTPFVPPRYFYRGSGTKLKAKEKDRPELQLAECLKAAGVTTPGEIRRHPLADGAMQGDKPLWDVVRAEIGEQTASGSPLVTVPTHRNGSSGRRGMEQRIGLFLEIEFEQPVALPFPALGHSAHFGLGVFVPAD